MTKKVAVFGAMGVTFAPIIEEHFAAKQKDWQVTKWACDDDEAARDAVLASTASRAASSSSQAHLVTCQSFCLAAKCSSIMGANVTPIAPKTATFLVMCVSRLPQRQIQ